MHFNPRMSIFLNKKGKPVRSIIVRTLPILHSTGPFLGTLPKNMWSVGTLKITKPCEMPQYFLKNPGGSSNFAQNSHPQFEIQSNTKLYFHLL